MSPIWWAIIALIAAGIIFLIYRRGFKTTAASITAFVLAIAAAVAEFAGAFTVPPGA